MPRLNRDAPAEWQHGHQQLGESVERKDRPGHCAVQAVEVTPEKKVVWALREWTKPNLGPATTIQILDEPGVPEDVHFGDIR